MVSANYIRVGRLVRILRGPRENKVGVITDIVDATRVLVENPHDEKMWRHVQSLKNVEPLKFNVAIPRNIKTAALKEALDKANTLGKYTKTNKARSIAAADALANATDFERYQLRVAKRSRAHWARKIFDENDKKKPISWHAKLLKKITKSAAKKDKSEGAKKRIAKAVDRRKKRLAKAKKQ
jgi:large subunit ribosomal protein L14e